MKIKIERQKNKKYKFSLFSEEKFLFGISEDTYVHFRLHAVTDLNETELHKIQDFELVMCCLHQAYRYLSRRPHLSRELSRKLYQKNYIKEHISETLMILKERKLLNDKDFIKQYISDEIKIKKSGPALIKKKIMEKGAILEEVEELLDLYYSDAQQQNNAEVLAFKKLKYIKEVDSIKMKPKLLSYLRQKGFDWEVCNRVITKIQSEESGED